MYSILLLPQISTWVSALLRFIASQDNDTDVKLKEGNLGRLSKSQP